MNGSAIRVLVVDDYEPWRRYCSTMLRRGQGLEVIGEVSDGLKAVQQAEELQPDLILLDIGLPTLNGIETARRIRKVSPASKILFVSETRSADIAEEALSTGALGYVVKSDAADELLRAVKTIVAGRRFISASLSGQASNLPISDHAAAITHSHELALYADDSSVVDGYARFVEISLTAGNAVIVVVTESHLASLLAKLEATRVDVPAAIEQGRYIPLDLADIISRVMVHDMPDPVRFTKVIGDLIMEAAKKVSGASSRVAVCGELSPTLLSKGNAEGAIQLERLWDEVTRSYELHVLCGYLSSAFPHPESDLVFQRICAEHSAICGREPGY